MGDEFIRFCKRNGGVLDVDEEREYTLYSCEIRQKDEEILLQYIDYHGTDIDELVAHYTRLVEELPEEAVEGLLTETLVELDEDILEPYLPRIFEMFESRPVSYECDVIATTGVGEEAGAVARCKMHLLIDEEDVEEAYSMIREVVNTLRDWSDIAEEFYSRMPIHLEYGR